MKNQYFGDEKDYVTYGLLRTLLRASRLRLGVAWMLTPDTANGEGELRAYLDRPEQWRDSDLYLFDFLRQVSSREHTRCVTLAEQMEILPGASFFSEMLPVETAERRGYFERLFSQLQGCDLLFFDPDNGIETRSTPNGKRRSVQHVYWDELEQAYHQHQCSLLVFQHFPRRRRDEYLNERAREIARRLPGARVGWYQTTHVAFFYIARPEHAAALTNGPEAVRAQWKDHIQPGEPAPEPALEKPGLNLELLDGLLAVCRLGPAEPLPTWPGGLLTALTRTPEELSIVCAEETVPGGVQAERGWRALKVAGPLDFGQTGILASLAGPLAQAGVSIFAISTYDTDYLLVKAAALHQALAALQSAGHQLRH